MKFLLLWTLATKTLLKVDIPGLQDSFLGYRITALSLHMLVWDWVSQAFGQCRTRITQCLSSTGVNIRLRKDKAWWSSSPSVLRTQSERKTRAWGEFCLGIRTVRQIPPFLSLLFPICEVGELAQRNPSWQVLVLQKGKLSHLSGGCSPHLDQEPLWWRFRQMSHLWRLQTFFFF